MEMQESMPIRAFRGQIPRFLFMTFVVFVV
jgi:hypothetical protein